MLVDANFFRGHGMKIGVIGIEFPAGGQKIERFEIEGERGKCSGFRKAEAIFFADERKGAALAFVAEEMLEPDAENEGNAGKSGQSGIELAVLELGEERGGKSGMAAEFDKAHFAAESQMLDLVADVILIQSLFEMGSDHAVRPFLTGFAIGDFQGENIRNNSQPETPRPALLLWDRRSARGIQ